MKYQEHISKLINRSIVLKQKVIKDENLSNIVKMAEIISDAIVNNNKLLICGNGGSAADAQHLAAELVVRLKSDCNRKALPAISLSLDSSFLTACGNDYSFDDIFKRALEGLGRKGDVLLGISTSGNSENVIRAIEKAKELEISTCTFLGSDGGKLKNIADYQYIVPSKETGRVQETHIMLGHSLMEIIEYILTDKKFI